MIEEHGEPAAKLPICPVCGEPREPNRKTCSKQCALTLRSQKCSESLKKKYASGTLNWLKEKQKNTGTENLINYNKSQKAKSTSARITTRRNLENNPMLRESVRNKLSETRKTGIATGRIANHLLLPDNMAKALRTKMDRYASGNLIHHMKNPKLAQQVSRSIKAAYSEGRLSPPNILNGKRYKQGYFVDKRGNRHYYASGWELSRMQFLNSCICIKWKKLTSEYKIPYTDLEGVERIYFPDFEIRANGKVIVEEVGTFTAAKQHKIAIAQEYFENRPENFIAIGKDKLHAKTW